MSDLHCPVCGTELDLAQVLAHCHAQQAVEQLVALSVPVADRVLSYCQLFAPQRTRLTLARKVKIITSLLPDLQRQRIQHRGHDCAAPHRHWLLAIDQMLAARAAGTLATPLKSHGYLYAILANLAEKPARGADATTTTPSPHPADWRDPTLVAIEQASRNAVPPPDWVRNRHQRPK